MWQDVRADDADDDAPCFDWCSEDSAEAHCKEPRCQGCGWDCSGSALCGSWCDAHLKSVHCGLGPCSGCGFCGKASAPTSKPPKPLLSSAATPFVLDLSSSSSSAEDSRSSIASSTSLPPPTPPSPSPRPQLGSPPPPLIIADYSLLDAARAEAEQDEREADVQITSSTEEGEEGEEEEDDEEDAVSAALSERVVVDFGGATAAHAAPVVSGSNAAPSTDAANDGEEDFSVSPAGRIGFLLLVALQCFTLIACCRGSGRLSPPDRRGGYRTAPVVEEEEDEAMLAVEEGAWDEVDDGDAAVGFDRSRKSKGKSKSSSSGKEPKSKKGRRGHG